MKTCTQCGRAKQLAEFYKKSSARDGHETRCSICAKAQVLAYLSTPSAIPLRRARVARYMRTAKGRAATRRYLGSTKDKAARMTYRLAHRQEVNARARVHTATKNGRLPAIAMCLCSTCGQPAIAYHHWKGYTPKDALEVRPLCRPCHIVAHVIH